MAWAEIILALAGGYILLCAGICTGEMHAHDEADRPDEALEARYHARVGLAVGVVLIGLAVAL